MAIINVPSATQGKSYSIKISGDVPTPTEQARIQKYVADQDAASQALVAKYFPAATEQAETAPEKGGLAGIGTALGRGVDLTQQGLYSAAEGIGSSTGIDWLRDFGKAGAEFNTKQLEESAAARTQLEDVKGVGSGLSFVGETAAESAAPLGVAMLGAGAAGAAAGSIFGPVGTAAGAIIGAGGAALSQLPLFYGWNRERQKQEDVTAGRPVEVDEGVAALAAIPQATIEGIADRFLVGKLLPPSFINKGMWLTRLGKGAAAGTVAEVPTEVGQQILERWQAGLPVDDDEAIEEYRQAAIAAAAVGGTIGGASAAIGGDQKAKDDAKLKELKKKQLAEDSSYMADYTDEARKFAEQNTAELYAASTSPTGETQVTPDEMLMLPSPTAFGKSKLKVAPIINPAAYSPEMRKQALDIATSRGKVTIGELNQALTELNQSNVSPKAVASLVQDLKKDGILRRAGRNGLAPTKGALQSRARLDSLNNSANQFDAEAQSLSQRNEELAANLRSAEQTGVDLSGKKANPSDIGRQIDQNTRDIEARKKLAESARADALKLAENIAPKQRERTALPHGIKAGPLSQATPKAALARQEAILQSLADNSNATKELNAKKRSLSNRQLSSVEQVALDDVNRKLEALKARRLALKTEAMSPEEAILDAQNQEAAEAAKVLEAQAQAEAREQAKLQRLGAAGTQQGEPLAPIFSSKMQNVFDSLRQYMSKMNVGNFGLAGANILDKFNDKGERETSEGLYDPGLRLISVSMGIYDPKLSEQELFDRIARVVDHEVIHALKSQGVFSEADWASLTRAASTMKYKAMKNGKLQDREYTYLERAQSMYAGQALDPPDWPNTTVALDLLSPQVLKELRKAAYQKKVKLGETVSISTIENLIGEETAKQVAKIEFAAEEAVAEMFRDYVDGRVKFVGKPKSLFDRVKDFFRALIGASIKNGIPDAQSILDDIKSGAVGARQQGIAPQVSQPVAQPLSAARTPSAAPVVAAPTPPVQAPAPVITEVPAPAQVQPTPEPVIAQAPEPIVEAPAPTPAPVSKTPAVEPEIKVDLPQKARKYGSVLKKNGALNMIGKFAFTFEADRINGKDHNRLRVRTLDGSKIFQSSNGSERDANVVDIWDVPDPNTVEHRGGSKVGIDSVGENVPPDLAPIFRDFLEGKIDPEETIKRIKNTDLGEADKSNGTSGVRQSKMTAEKAYKIRNDAYKERASLLNGKNVFSYPTKSEMQAWIAQSDMRYQDAPKVFSKSIFSPEFKLFFGKSQIVVVDQNGVEYPRRVFHGGPHGDIYEFDFSKIGPEELGFHVGTAEQANEFAFGLPREKLTDTGNLYPLYVRLENPVRLKDLGSWTAENIFPQMRDKGLITEAQFKQFMIAARKGSTGSQEKIRNILQSLGYDGVSYLNRYEGFSQEDMARAKAFAKQNGTTVSFFMNNLTEDRVKQFFPSAQDSYILLKPTQIKSAVGNNGEYSTLNKDIRYSALVPKKGNENAEGQVGSPELGRDRGTGDRSGGLSPLSGAPKVSGASGPDPRLNAVAEKYARDNGIDLYRQSDYVKIDRDLSTRLSDAYQDMLDDPANPVVREAYENMINQTTAQYKALVDDGYQFYFFDDVNDPYEGNPWNAMRDLRATKTMGVYATEAGYGSDDASFNVETNPLLVDTGFRWSYGKDGEKNRPVLANDLFRAVHDAFGHGLEGSGFRARGEENAWQAHARLFTGTALHAMTSETRGQNSWLNFGPYGKENENAKVYETTFATQKIGLMPSWTWTEGKAGDQKKSLGDELKVRESRMISSVKPVTNVPQELKRLTVLDMMDPTTGVFIQRDGKKISVIDAIQELFNRRADTIINPDDPNAVNRVAELIALEAQMAVLRNPGAIGWYGETLSLAKRVAAMEYPEISPVNPYSGEKSNSYDPMSEHIWDLATAITSNGQAVVDNFTHAAEQYEYWKANGRFKEIGYGKQATGIVSGLKFYNSMRDVGYSDEQIQEFLSEKMTVRDLKNHPVIKELGLDIGSGESVDTEVYGSYILGPKIGQGFYQNLRGNFSPLTMDLWFSRLFNRITGLPFVTVTDETKAKNFDRINLAASNPMLSDYERSLLDQAKAVTNTDVITPETVGPLSIAYNKLFQRDFIKFYNQELKRLVSLGYDPKLQETKDLAKLARPEKTELILAMDRASQNFQDTEQATPRNSSERTFMRQVIDRAQAKVLQATGVEINTADFQALLWYAEKQLYKAMNVGEGRGGDNDYVDGVIHFLRKKGISDEEIKRVLPDSERNRLVSGTDSARQDAGVLSGTEATDEGQADGGNQLLPQTPNGDSEATVARNGGIGSRAKPKRGAEAVAEAKKETPVRLSRLMAHTPQGRATPFTGHSDLLKHADTLRYAAVQGAVSRLIQRTVGKYFKIDPSIIEDKTTNFFKKMQDDMIHVGKLYDNLRGKGIDIPQEYDAYFQEQLMRDAAGAKKQDFQQGFLKKIVETAVNAKFDSTNISSLEAEVKSAIGVDGYITQIMKKVGNESHAIANAYLYALHAKERNQRIREMSKGKDTKGSGMSDAEADAILNWKNTLPRDQQNALENVDKLAQDIIWMTNDEYIQGGLIPVYNDDKAILDDGTEVDFPQYDNYVPLRGFTDPENSEDAVEGGGGGGSKFGAKGKPNKSSVGRTSYAGDILVNIGTQYEAAVDKAARNKVGQSFLSLLEDGGVDLSDIAFVYESHPLMKAVVNGTIRTVPSRDFNDPDLPILPVRRNGKEILIGFHDANIGAAMKGTMGSGDPNVVMSAIHNVTRFYANLLTSWNPAFVLGNLPRDIETAIFNSQQYNMKGSSGAIIKKVGPSIKAIWGEINKTGAGDPHLRMRYRQFYENGGQSVFSGMVSLTNSTKGVKGIINEVEGLAGNNPIFKSKHFFTKTLLGKVEAANNAVENGTRLAFFDAMMNELEAQGVPTKVAAKRAAYAAKNLTTNFTKGGEFRNGLNTFYLFYNASLQGSMAMMNSLVRSKNARKMAASIIVMGFMMDMLNAAASDDEDEDGILDYDNFNDNRLENYILIPDFSGTGTHISIPLAYGLNIFYNAGRTLSNFTRGIAGAKGTYTAGEAAASTIGKVTSTLNPFGGNNMLSMLSPTQTDLIVELVTNKDFKDQPIYKELSPFDQSKSQSNLYWSSTSPSAVWMSKFLNDTIGGGTDIIPGEILGNRVDIQPDIIEHVLGFITGGLGTFVGASFDTATSTIPDAFAGRWEADMIGKTPILNKFLTKTTEKDKAGDYYDNRDKVMVVSAEIKDAIKSGDAERIAAARSTYPERIKVMGRIAEIEKRLLKLRKTRKLIVKSATMPEDKKQKSIDNIDQAINKLMSLGNQIMGEAGV
jgi:hypothetical protein